MSREMPLRFENYELVGTPEDSLLGEGTFGRTYRVQQSFLKTDAALKVIRRRFAQNPKFRESFLEEARIAARLKHPNIVDILYFGEIEEWLYCVMEFCDGGNLESLADRGVPSDEVIAEVARQTASALQFAHEENLIHRDLKPENIMLVKKGSHGGHLEVKVIDFGLAKSVVSEEGFEEAKNEGFRGTPQFASPEQIREETLDARTDIFSLGMTLWWFATGGRLDFGTEKEMYDERLSMDSYETRLSETLSPAVYQMIEPLLRKERSQRCARAGDLVEWLDENWPLTSIPSDNEVRLGAVPLEPAQPEVIEASINVGLGGLKYLRNVNGLMALSEARSQSSGFRRFVWHWEHGSLNESQYEDVACKIAVLQTNAPGGVSSLTSFQRYSDEYAVVFEMEATTPLEEGLNGRMQFELKELQDCLKSVARAVDELGMFGFPVPLLSTDLVFWKTDELQFADLVPSFFEEAGQDSTGTMLAESIGGLSRGQIFVFMVYGLLAGRRLPAAALRSSASYVSVPSINEDSNRYLKQWAVESEGENSCGVMLDTLLISEGLIKHRFAGTGSSRTSQYRTKTQARSRFANMESSGAPRPFASFSEAIVPEVSESLAEAVPKDIDYGSERGDAPLEVEQPVSVSEKSASHSKSAKEQEVTQPVSPPSTPQIPPKTLRRKKWVPVALMASAVALFGGVLAVIFWPKDKSVGKEEELIVADSKSEPQVDRERMESEGRIQALWQDEGRRAEMEQLLSRYESTYGRNNSFAQDTRQVLKRMKSKAPMTLLVPRDYSTLADAMEQAFAGQTIELEAGEHSAQVILKPGVNIRGQGNRVAVLQLPNPSASVLTLRESGVVLVENVVIEAISQPAQSPNLVSVQQGSLRLFNCAIRNGGSNGLYCSDGELVLSSCLVEGHELDGLRLVGKGQAKIEGTELCRNRRHGICLENCYGSIEVKTSESKENVENGLSAEGGGKLELKDSRFSENGKFGAEVIGEGVVVSADGCQFNSNAVTGLGVGAGSRIEAVACRFERNQEHGALFEGAVQASKMTKATLVQNGSCGISINVGNEPKSDQPVLRVSESTFRSHAMAAIALAGQASAVVTESEFSDNVVSFGVFPKAVLQISNCLVRFSPKKNQAVEEVFAGGTLHRENVTEEQL